MANAEFRLKGHESFVPREGWLSKGLEAVHKNPAVFRSQNFYGADDLGVGTNMAKSIRYWMHVMGLSVRGKNGEDLTELGNWILKKDPYLEEEFYLWILHLNLIQNKELASSWYLFFSQPLEAEFDREGLFEYLRIQLEEQMKVTSFTEKSLRDDVTALLGMYCLDLKKKEQQDPEEKAICPFTHLHLIVKTGRKFHNTETDYEKLSEFVLLYLIVEFFMKKEKNGISIRTLFWGTCGVGAALHMTEMRMNEYLDRLENRGFLQINRTAGLDMIYLTKNAPETGMEVLEIYDETRNR